MLIGNNNSFAKQQNVNPFPNKPWFLHVCRTSLMKTLLEKEKLLMTSKFSVSHSIFYPQKIENFLPLSSNLKLTHFVLKSLRFVTLERFKLIQFHWIQFLKLSFKRWKTMWQKAENAGFSHNVYKSVYHSISS